jgi:hypothetical protein
MEFDHVSISYLDLSRVLQGVPRRNAKALSGELMREVAAGLRHLFLPVEFFTRRFSSLISGAAQMERERDKIDCNDLAGIWRNAE